MTKKIILGRDFEVEVIITPLDHGFEPVDEAMIIRSSTCVTNLDEIMTRGAAFLMGLPNSDNHTSWN